MFPCYSQFVPPSLSSTMSKRPFSMSVSLAAQQIGSSGPTFSVQFSSAAQSCLTLCNPMASMSITNPWSLLKLMSIELVMPSNHLILIYSLFLLPSIFTSIRVFSNESVLCIRWPKYWNFSFSISLSNELEYLQLRAKPCSRYRKYPMPIEN